MPDIILPDPAMITPRCAFRDNKNTIITLYIAQEL
jgi:hypothetical protein